MNRNTNQYLACYLVIVFAVSWTLLISCGMFARYLTPIIGELTLTHPLIIFILYLPSITGLLVYAAMGGGEAIKRILWKLIPRKQDLFWFPVIFIIFILFAAFVRYGSILFNIPVPKITYSIPQLIEQALWNFIAETGLVGGIFGWVAFLLPVLQGKFKSNIKGALLTGFIFGLWILPGYNVSSLQASTSYGLYVLQLMLFMLFASYIFNATKGNLTFYLFAFWLAATGSHIQLYYFNITAQILEIVFLGVASIVLHIVLRKANRDHSLQTFPKFINENILDVSSRVIMYSRN